MRRILALSLAFLCGFCIPVNAELRAISNPSGQIPGTATNDSAAAGNVGEYFTAQSNANIIAGATITIASPAVVTAAPIPFTFAGTGCHAINFTTTGALPTGIVAGTNYFVVPSSISGNTFQIATSCDNAITGTAINTSGTQSGVHTAAPMALLTTGGAVAFAGLRLTPGDYEVSCYARYRSAASTTVSNAYSSVAGVAENLSWASGTVLGATDTSVISGPHRLTVSATSNNFCNGLSTFGTSTMQVWGQMRARRVR